MHSLKGYLPFIIAVYMVCHAVNAAEPSTEVSVSTGKIIRTSLHRYVSAFGVVEPEPETRSNAAASSKIAAPTQGIIAQSHCVEGLAVKKGALLFTLDSRATEVLIAKTQVGVDFAQKNLTRKKRLYDTGNVSQKFYEDAEQLLQSARNDFQNAQLQRELLRVNAPLTGVVTVCYTKIGEAVNPGVVLAEVINLQRLTVSLRVPSVEAKLLSLKQTVAFNADDLVSSSPSHEQSHINFISTQVDPLTDTLLVRAPLPADSALRSGQMLSARIVVEELNDRLAVPVAGVVTNDDGSYIALVEGDRAKQQAVTLGLRDGNLVEISGEGLHEGMTLVTEGIYGLPNETRIQLQK